MLNIDGVGDAFDQLKEDVRDVNTSKLKTFGALVMGRVPEPYTENAVFQDHEGAKKSFAPHYEHFIKPEIQEFERRRIATLKSLSQRAFFSLCLIVAGVVMGLVFIAQGYGATLSNDNGEAILKIILLDFDTGSIFEPATFTQEIQLILNEMNVIFKIIDELKLNEKTGL
jgi:hypothetical protein